MNVAIDRNYLLLYRKYQKLLNSPTWKATKPMRVFFDYVKEKLNIEQKRTPHTNDPYEILLDNYSSLVDCRTWILISPFRKLIERNHHEDSQEIENLDSKYSVWIEKNESSLERNIELEYRPLISIIVPVYNVKTEYLIECVQSVKKQSYNNYELILINDGLVSTELSNYYAELKEEKRIRIIINKKHEGISFATNTGIQNAKGEYVAFLDDDDTISENALYEIVKELNINKNIELLYCDEDKIDATSNTRFMPNFKPDYSPDLLLNNNYINHFLIIKKTICDIVGNFNSKFDGCQDYDYVLRCTELIDPINIKHISKVLYHWRAIDGSTSLDINQKDINGITESIKYETIKRRKLLAKLENDGNIYYESDKRKVSIIIPSKDNFEYLKKCIDSVRQTNSYDKYEFVIVDNGSEEKTKELINDYIKDSTNIKYIYIPMQFNFSKSCNIGVEQSDGDYLLFLNDDVQMISNDILDRLTGYARQKHIGAVGIKLLYPNSSIIQHCGIINTFPGPMHYLQHLNDNDIQYKSFNRMVSDVSAVTGACMMIERSKFNKINRFDENFSANYNDVDLCFRLLDANYYNVVLNNVYSYHNESLTRDVSDERKILYETRNLYTKHANKFLEDSFYNKAFKLSSNNFEI